MGPVSDVVGSLRHALTLPFPAGRAPPHRSRAALIFSAIRGAVMLWQLEPERYEREALWRELDTSIRLSLARSR